MANRVRLGAGALVVVAGVAAAAMAANQATITNVQVTPKVMTGKGTHYLSVKFVVNVDEHITSNKTLQINSTCKAGSRTLNADTFANITVKGLTKGTSKDGSAVQFMNDKVTDPIDNYSMTFELHELGKKYTDKPLNEFCYKGGKVTDGPCQ